VPGRVPHAMMAPRHEGGASAAQPRADGVLATRCWHEGEQRTGALGGRRRSEGRDAIIGGGVRSACGVYAVRRRVRVERGGARRAAGCGAPRCVVSGGARCGVVHGGARCERNKGQGRVPGLSLGPGQGGAYSRGRVIAWSRGCVVAWPRGRVSARPCPWGRGRSPRSEQRVAEATTVAAVAMRPLEARRWRRYGGMRGGRAALPWSRGGKHKGRPKALGREGARRGRGRGAGRG
jgi:hypothetical protein